MIMRCLRIRGKSIFFIYQLDKESKMKDEANGNIQGNSLGKVTKGFE